MAPENHGPTALGDDGLLGRARAGDRDAVAALFARHRGPLVRFCRHYLGGLDAAEDVAHDVLARVAEGEHWPQSSFRAWLYRVARNQCLNHQRRRRDGRIGFGVDFGESRIASPRTGPGTAAIRGEREQALRTALAAMPPPLAEVLSLRYFQGLTRREMADVLELSEGALKQLLVQARSELARKLDKERP